MADRKIELLNKSHKRGEFSCGKAPLDIFLREQAGQYSRKGIGRTYVAVQANDSKVLGYYTLAAGSVPFASVPKELVKKLPEHPIPVVLIGRLAVDQTQRGTGLGKSLLMDACARVLNLADLVGIFAVHVQAIDDDAHRFYEHHEFRSLVDQPNHLVLPITTIRDGFK